MRMKRFLAGVLVSIMCVMLVACQNDSVIKNNDAKTENTDVTQNSTATPLLYRVTNENGNVIWLFGSIHVGREDYYPLPENVLDAFEDADSLAVELDLLAVEKDMKLQMKALSQLIYYDGSKIQDHIPQDLYEESVAILDSYGKNMKALESYCPAFWASMIESLMMSELGGDVNLGIDRHLINMAYESEKEVLEIESAEFQYKMLADFDDDVQILLLESAVESYEDKEKAAEEIKMLMDSWAEGDTLIEYLNASDDTMTAEEAQIYEKYNQAVVTDRNLNMTEFAEDALSDGEEIFICVGAAHVVGDGAMADLLAERGYTVECITE